MLGRQQLLRRRSQRIPLVEFILILREIATVNYCERLPRLVREKLCCDPLQPNATYAMKAGGKTKSGPHGRAVRINLPLRVFWRGGCHRRTRRPFCFAIAWSRMPKESRPADALWSIAETAEYLGVSETCIRRLAKRKIIASVAIGRRILLRPSTVRSFVDDREEGGSLPRRRFGRPHVRPRGAS